MLAVVLALGATACGSSGDRVARSHDKKPCARAVRATARLKADVEVIRTAARRPTRNTLMGNSAVNTATDRFLLDLAHAPISQLARNRFIDHAAAALVGSCEQCFQALEAGRPIPAIAHSGAGACPGA